MPDLRWHFIGHVQSNKIKTIVHYAASVHALSDLRHARLLANAAAAEKKAPFPVYLAVNAEGEAEKSGLEPGQVGITAHRISQECPELDLRGIMCVPPATYHDAAEGPVVVPKLYSELAALSRGVGRGELSLGMSSDLKMAIYAGATTVRIGSALFGARA